MTLGIPLKNKHSKHIAGPAEFIGLTETRTEKNRLDSWSTYSIRTCVHYGNVIYIRVVRTSLIDQSARQ